MPWKVEKTGDKWGVFKEGGELVASHDTEAEALAHQRALYANTKGERMDEPQLRWVEPFAYKSGQPFRVMPLGTYKRGGRTLELTEARLKQMATNYDTGKPRWKIPLYFGHPTGENPDPPKVGNVKRLFMDKDGLYAEPEWTPDGEGAVADGKYQFVSPGVLWSLSPGSEYVDDQGQKHDNVIDHVALTNKPFFGANVALFSEVPMQPAQPQEQQPAANPAAEIMALMKQAYAKLQAMLGGGQPQAPPQAPPFKPETASENIEPEKMAAGAVEKEKTMPEVTAEEFAAVKTKAETFEAQAKELATKLSASETARRKQDWEKVVGETFAAVPAKNEVLVEKFMALEEKDPELSKFFLDLLGKADVALRESALFAQLSSERGNPKAETFADKVAAVKMELKTDNYEVALAEASKRFPELAKAYKEQGE